MILNLPRPRRRTVAHLPRRQSWRLVHAVKLVQDGGTPKGKAELVHSEIGVIGFWPREAFCRMRFHQHLHLAALSLCRLGSNGSGMMSCPAVLCIMDVLRLRQFLLNVLLEHS